MNFQAFSAALLVAGLAHSTFAREPLPPPTDQVSVELAPPPLDGTVSIGVFDSTGKCIRVLYKSADSDSIPSALNGFLITWDGKTDAGTSAAKGEYEIRGVTVGDVTAEGEAYHFNDWINSDEPAFSPTSTKLVKLFDNGDFLVFQSLFSEANQLALHNSEGLLQWNKVTKLPLVDLVIFGRNAYLASTNRLQKFGIAQEASDASKEIPEKLIALAPSPTGLLGVVQNKLVLFNPSTLDATPISNLPPAIKMLAARGNTTLASDGMSVFRQNGDHFEKINLPTTDPITHLAIGRESAFWITTSAATLTEFDFEGNALRSLEPEGEDIFLTFDVNATDNQIALVSSKGDRQRFRILQLTDSPDSDVSLWKTTLQKDSQPCVEFGIDPATSQLIAHGDLPKEKSFLISLVENPLTPGNKATIRLTFASLDHGLWLTANNGLPLIPIASDLSSQRMALIRGKKTDSLHFYANIGGAVAEFSIGGLSNMMQFTSEKIQWPPGPRQSADETNVPNTEPATK